MRYIELILLFSVIYTVVGSKIHNSHEFRVVNTTQGPVKGYKSDELFHFYGIPYATAPTGKRRFTAPLPGPVWMSPLEAVNRDIICPQSQSVVLYGTKYDMREDCLIVNVHVPDTDATNLPVVIYIHGGASQLGYGEIATPTPLAKTKKVIAVTFNYRLGVHGFLCLGTENAPGNAGTKDQVALLRWVQKNIASFGGNPDEVTLAGFSSGSTSVDLLMLSKVTDGLFNKAIPESGTGFSVLSIQIDPVQRAIDFARDLNFTDIDFDLNGLDEFYTTVSFDTLMSKNILKRTDSTFGFTPCVERGTNSDKVIDDDPINILKQGNYRKIPILSGFTSMEGLFRAENFEEWQDQINAQFSDFLPADLQFKDKTEKEEVAKIVKEFYFGEASISKENLQSFVDYFSDVLFVYPNLRVVKLYIEAGSESVYQYEYSFVRPFGAHAITPDFIKNIKGATHGAQSFTVLDNPGYEVEYGPDAEDYKQMKRTMVELWVNFITTGKPVPKGSHFPSWPPVGGNGYPRMELAEKLQLKTKDTILQGSLPLQNRTHFWDSIYDKYYYLRPKVVYSL